MLQALLANWLNFKVQDQLGLRFESAKGAVRKLMIDHVDNPSENSGRSGLPVGMTSELIAQEHLLM